jgi:hypothetical protein
MTTPKPLSPAAQKVLDAYETTHGVSPGIAAALRAAVDHIDLLIERCYSPQQAEERWNVLNAFLEIANELEGHHG